MSKEVKVPVFPESVTDGTIVAWHKQAGDTVNRDEIIAEIETDKVVFEIPAPEDGVLTEIVQAEGATVESEQLIAQLDNSDEAKAKAASAGASAAAASEAENVDAAEAAASEPVATSTPGTDTGNAMPAATKMINENNLDPSQISGSGKGGRILKEDVQKHMQGGRASTAMASGARTEKRVPMTRLRARIAERLVEAQQTAAILTTFNEVNMKPVMDLRKRYKDLFEKTHDVKLGFMSFFVKACVEALRKFPEINASVDGDDIVYHGYFDVGIAVGSPRGLVVPILRDADQLSIANIERRIMDFGQRAQSGKLDLDEITGGTFSITNGGVFGSLLSTPILNPPQSGILGMHKIQERPMVENGEIVVLPMMYLALSYDHRIVDGREAVQFLVTIKQLLEDPSRLLLDV